MEFNTLTRLDWQQREKNDTRQPSGGWSQRDIRWLNDVYGKCFELDMIFTREQFSGSALS